MDWYNETIAGALDKVVRRNPNAEALVQHEHDLDRLGDAPDGDIKRGKSDV